MKSLLILSALISLSAASITVGKCPVYGANNPDFDPALYLGDWYTAVTNFFPEQAGTAISCQRAQYGLLPDGSVSVYNVQTDPDGTFNEICGCAALSDAPGELCVNFAPGTQEGCGPAGNADCFSNYWVLETDYESYTVIYSCVEILELRNEFAWVLTREQNADPALVDYGLRVLAGLNITLDLPAVPQPETCLYDIEDSCTSNYP